VLFIVGLLLFIVVYCHPSLLFPSFLGKSGGKSAGGRGKKAGAAKAQSRSARKL